MLRRRGSVNAPGDLTDLHIVIIISITIIIIIVILITISIVAISIITNIISTITYYY